MTGSLLKSKQWFLGVLTILLIMLGGQAQALVINLDADTAATGSNLDTAPLVTAAGTIGFTGRIQNFTDPDFTAVGASGNNFNIGGTSSSATPGILDFSFDVMSLEFIFGGNGGMAYFEALDVDGNVVDTYMQESTNNGFFAGPLILSGAGIRSLVWYDGPGWNFLGIDNVIITTAEVPEASTILLMLAGLMAVGFASRRKESFVSNVNYSC